MNTRHTAGRAFGIALRATVTALVCFLVVRRIGAGRMVEIASHMHATWLLFGLGLAVLQLLISAKRWQYLYGLFAETRPTLWRMVQLTGKSLLFGQLLPSSLGADLIRTGAIAGHGGVVAAARSVVCDRLAGLLVLLVIVLLTLPLLALKIGAHPALASIGAISLCGLAAFAALALAMRFPQLPLAGKVLALAGCDLRQALSVKSFGPVFGSSAAIHLLSIILFAALLHSIGAGVPLLACVIVVPSAGLIASIPISLGGWGMREAAMASGFALLGSDSAAAATASVLYGLSAPVSGLLIEALTLFTGTAPRRTAELADHIR